MTLAADMLGLCRKASPEDFGLHMLGCDPVGARLPADQRRNLVQAALEDGAAVASALRARYPGMSPGRIAGLLGVHVVETDEPPWAGPLLRHADYCAAPPEIRLFRTALDPLDRLLEIPEIGGLIGATRAGPVFLAHEIYHHVEATRDAPPLARRHAVTKLRLRPWRLAAPVLALSEIAAGACAQALIGLKHHAAILDLLALWRVAPMVAAKRVAMFYTSIN